MDDFLNFFNFEDFEDDDSSNQNDDYLRKEAAVNSFISALEEKLKEVNNVREEIIEYVKNMLLRFLNRAYKSVAYSFSQDEINSFNKIPEFSITDTPYSIDDIIDFLVDYMSELVDVTGAADILDTATYTIFCELIPSLKILDNLDLEEIINHVLTPSLREKLTSKEFHKIAILNEATKLCISQKTISFNKAIKLVCEREMNGFPAYKQIISGKDKARIMDESSTIISFIIENDEEIAMSFSLAALMAMLNDT